MILTLTPKHKTRTSNHIMRASTPCYVHDLGESCKISDSQEQSVKVNAFLICRDSHGVAAVRTCSASSDSECRLQRYEQKSEPPSDSVSFFDEERKYSLYTPIGRRCQRHQIGVASHTAVPEVRRNGWEILEHPIAEVEKNSQGAHCTGCAAAP